MNIPIVIIGYNRHNSLKRLLKSLKNATYECKNIELIISLDRSDNHKVYDIANEFEWEHGEKIIIKHKQKLGLREHVLICGDIVNDYDAIVMLEDDLVVSESFYKFTLESVKYYNDDKKIGGISLYSYRNSEFANLRTFIPTEDDSDVYFMNVPSSWGQIWTKGQWTSFRKWYKEMKYLSIDFNGKLPAPALNWGENSWKKYFYMYIVLSKKYIVYPRVGLSTNMGEIGTHHKAISTDHQSLLMGVFKREYFFVELKHSNSVYDAFFENEKLNQVLLLDKDLIVDYYGIKEISGKQCYLLSTRKTNYKIIKTWALALKPYELNVKYNINGEGLYLYDLNSKVNDSENTISEKQQRINLVRYELPGINRKKALSIVLDDYKLSLRRKFTKLLTIIFQNNYSKYN